MATRDWVLFRRRRRVKCDEAPVVVEQPTKTYRVLTLPVPRDALKEVAAAINQDGAALSRLKFRSVGDVAFAGGRAELTSDATAVVEDWQAAKPGSQIALAVIATDATDDSDALLEARVRAYEQAVSSVTPVAANASLDRLPARDNAPAGTDGQIIVVTVTAPPMEYEVYGLITVSDAAQLVSEALKENDLKAALAAPGVVELGTVILPADSAANPISSIRSLADVQLDGPVHRVVPLQPGGDDRRRGAGRAPARRGDHDRRRDPQRGHADAVRGRRRGELADRGTARAAVEGGRRDHMRLPAPGAVR